MIDWRGGLFAGLRLGILYVILGVETYFLIIEKCIEKILSQMEILVLLISLVLAIIIIAFCSSIFSLFLIPAAYVFLQFRKKKIQQNRQQ